MSTDTPNSSTRLLTLQQTASQLAVSRATVYRLIDRGELPTVKIRRSIRIDQADLTTFIAGCRS